MNGEVKVGRIAGIEVTADWSLAVVFVLITCCLGAAVFESGHPQWPAPLSWLSAFGVAVLFVASVLFHELAHAVVARRSGVHIRSTTLFVFGGVTDVGLDPASPAAELRMAFAGVTASLTLGLVCFVLAAAGVGALGYGGEQHATRALADLSPGSVVLLWLGWMNVGLCAINLLPGYPLDGGRALYAIVWRVTADHRRATRIACRMGQVLGWTSIVAGVGTSFGVVAPVFEGGLSAGPWLMLMGWFLNRAARAGYSSMLIGDVYRGLAILDALIDVTLSKVMRDFPTRLHPKDGLRDLQQCIPAASGQPLLPIEADGIFLGWVRREDLADFDLAALETVRLCELMVPVACLPSLQPQHTVSDAIALMEQARLDYVPIVEQQRLLGVVSRQDLGKWMCRQMEAADIDRELSSKAHSDVH
jgi:Zn-dependent protease/predicted transcriptional regulator